MNLAERKGLIRAALGEDPLDLIIKNVRVVNVYTGEVEPGAIGIRDGRIITPDAIDYAASQVIDGGGRYAIPGFFDTHVHLDSTLVIPEAIGMPPINVNRT